MFQRLNGSISGLYHKTAKDKIIEANPALFGPENLWPNAWREQSIKSYAGAPTVKLACDDVYLQNIAFGEALSVRKSSQDFTGELNLEQLGTVLVASAGIADTRNLDANPRRPYPSGGSRYPLEIYVWSKSVAGILPGVYHFRPDNHELEHLYVSRMKFLDPSVLLGYEWSWGAAAVIFVTATFERSQDKYGERGYRYTLLEAGHLMQNLHLIASALGMPSCPFGASRDEMVERVLDIDGTSESLVHTLILG